MHIGFSYMGLIYLIMLFAPNILWTRNKPKEYQQFVGNENKTLLFLERIGEMSACCFVLIFSDFNIHAFSMRSVWLLASIMFMLFYECFWIRYFKSNQTMKDFYCSFLGVPVAGATLPVLAFLFLAIYGRNPFLFASVIILGVGHIGIHLNHRRDI